MIASNNKMIINHNQSILFINNNTINITTKISTIGPFIIILNDIFSKNNCHY